MFKNWFFKKFFKKQFAIARFISTYTNIPVNPVPGVRLGGHPPARLYVSHSEDDFLRSSRALAQNFIRKTSEKACSTPSPVNRDTKEPPPEEAKRMRRKSSGGAAVDRGGDAQRGFTAPRDRAKRRYCMVRMSHESLQTACGKVSQVQRVSLCHF